MGEKRKFCGPTFIDLKKCEQCTKRDECKNGPFAFTSKRILIDCEAFYYVFNKLETFIAYPSYDGDEDKFYRDLQKYEEKFQGIPRLIPPMVVNGTLAVELALKFLILKENGEYECGHNLQVLFNQLPEPHRTVLSEHIYKEAHQNAETLAVNLRQISNLFENYRYFYEHKTLGYTNFLNEFIHIVCDYAISLKNEYEETEE